MPPGSELSFCSNISSSLHQCNMEHSLHTPSAVSHHFMHVQNHEYLTGIGLRNICTEKLSRTGKETLLMFQYYGRRVSESICCFFDNRNKVSK